MDLRLKMAQIDRELVRHGEPRVPEIVCVQQDTMLPPWLLVFGGMAIGAGFFAACLALVHVSCV